MKIRRERITGSPEVKDIVLVKWDAVVRVGDRHYRFKRGQLVSKEHPAVASAPDCFHRAAINHPWPPRAKK